MNAVWDRPAACSGRSRAAAEPLAGSAPFTRVWLLVSDPGPWGGRAPATARASFGGELAAATAGIGDFAVVLTRPVRTARGGTTNTAASRAPRRRLCWLAYCGVDRSWLASALLGEAALLDSLADDVAAAGTGMIPAGWSPAAPVTLVCVNARRDPCCGVLGRPTAQRLVTADPMGTTVLESSHLGGHRFAPVLLDLPSGWMFGRCSPHEAPARSLDHSRGRVSLPGRLQAAEIAALRAAGYATPVACRVTEGEIVLVRTPDGRQWQVAVETVALDPIPASCGRAATGGEAFAATALAARTMN